MRRTKKSKNFQENGIVKVGKNTATSIELHNGQRPMFTLEVLDQIEMLGQLGATDDQIAMFFGKTSQAIANWGRRYPEFVEARKRGGIVADMQMAGSLFKRGNGFYYEEEEMKYVEKKWQKFSVKKYCIPDTTALIFWLKNRQRELWTDVHKVQYGGSVEHLHKKVEDVDVTQLSKQAQDALFEIANAQLTDGIRDN